MTNKGILGFILGGLFIVAAVGFYFYSQKNAQNDNQNTRGELILGITDAAASIEDVTSVTMTITGVQIHSQSKGWITLSNEEKEYDLLALKEEGVVSLLANISLDGGTYDQVKLMVSKVVTTENGVEKEAQLVSGELKIQGTLVVAENKTATAVFDFIADESLHKTANAAFVFLPVITVETRSGATTDITDKNNIKIEGGTIETQTTVGMDVDGQLKENFKVDQNTPIDITGNVLEVPAQE